MFYSNSNSNDKYYQAYIVEKDNYLYGAYRDDGNYVKLDKVMDKKIINIDFTKSEENIISIEFV